ncbi:hypothetical protein FQN55_002688 [Onygenales sp. PD_40]|nr:hypothetical protein FQN55_002688 [Onygenales sp. PD_40]KAK2797807.1 hypothetical protein FQN51_008263 [Onygenales sp. PD_10]
MPHSNVVPHAGFQALILCGPGVSLNTFTSNPEEFPKALVPIANRPMVWYPLDWCYRMGITNITLITPESSQPALEAALSQNPHLTSLPSPSPSVLAPPDLTFTTGTSELLRLPEVQTCIKSDFMLLPCDLICDLLGESLLEAWMSNHGALDGSSVGEAFSNRVSSMVGVSGEKGGRRGGIGVWYPMPTKEEKVKGDVADFLAVAPLDEDDAPAAKGGPGGNGSVRASLSKLVYAAPMDTLKNTMEENKAFLIRHSLVKRHGKVKLLTTYRDAHIYMFPYWVKEMAKRNERFESVSEDLIGWWAKAEWQDGLGEKLGLREVFAEQEKETNPSAFGTNSHDIERVEQEIDLTAMSTTKSGTYSAVKSDGSSEPTTTSTPLLLPTRTNTFPQHPDDTEPAKNQGKLTVPPILAYVHPSQPSAPLIRRVDSSALLLSISLKLAKLDSITDLGSRDAASPFAHTNKIAYPAGVAARCTITKADCLVADNVTVEEKCVIKESVIGANCHIASGVRLTRCLLMDGAVVEERCQLTGCIIGRRSKIGRESVLKDCEVQDGNVVPEETEAAGEKFMVFEGLDEEMDEFDDGEMEGEGGEGGF